MVTLPRISGADAPLSLLSSQSQSIWSHQVGGHMLFFAPNLTDLHHTPKHVNLGIVCQGVRQLKKLPPLLDSSDMLVTLTPKNGHVTPDIRGWRTP
jgi:hypothetical protein